eukprot:TRINITY_DN8089_c0_g1_i4.p1 TRINITY_DN8089_c0_g1~~TRINITY_DN8089_c0_g1_i4.p1  ORF type:complete len:159 (-),score=34.66 TRINITY_DN8089_c0_g1_i4:96-572(-)
MEVERERGEGDGDSGDGGGGMELDSQPQPSGRVVSVREILSPQRPTRLPRFVAGDSVRVTGKVDQWSVVTNTGVLDDDDHKLHLDLSLLSQVPFTTDTLYQCIGELQLDHSGEWTLLVRVVRDVTGLDRNLYNEALALQRHFLATTLPPTTTTTSATP